MDVPMRASIGKDATPLQRYKLINKLYHHLEKKGGMVNYLKEVVKQQPETVGVWTKINNDWCHFPSTQKLSMHVCNFCGMVNVVDVRF